MEDLERCGDGGQDGTLDPVLEGKGNGHGADENLARRQRLVRARPGRGSAAGEGEAANIR